MNMADLGNFTLAVAVLAAMVGVLAAIAAVRFESARALTASRWLIGGIAAMLTVAVAALAVAMIKCDFRIVYVSHYTENALPLGYKLAAVWAGQEGSILLWGWLVAVMS